MFLRASSKAAQAFGFSSPFSEEDPQRVSLLANPYMANSDGSRPEVKLGISNSAKMEVLPGFAGSDLDEMNIEYMCNRPAFVFTSNWTTGTSPGTNLYSTSCGPNSFIVPGTVNTNTVSTMPPFSYLAQFFALWRADIVFTIKVVKTEFHTGRLEAVFNPGLPASYSSLAKAYMSRQIMDLKECDTFVIKVPYVNLTPMESIEQGFGEFRINVVNSLNAPGSVSASVALLIEVSAENVAFAQPVAHSWAPINGTASGFTPQSYLSTFEYQSAIGMHPDMSQSEEVAPREKVYVMPGLEQTTKPFDALRHSNSECITSIKQLLTRNSITVDSTDYVTNTPKSVSYLPWTVGAYALDGAAATITPSPFTGDYVSAFSSLFVLRRGSVRYFFNNTSPYGAGDTKSANYSCVSFNRIAFNATAQASLSTSSSTAAFMQNRYSDDKAVSGTALTVNVPQYSRTHSMGCAATFGTDTRVLDIGEPALLLRYSTTASIPGNFNYSWSRMAGDDYQLGYFIGVPVVYNSVNIRDKI